MGKSYLACIGLSVIASQSFAIVNVGPFTGSSSESFESFPNFNSGAQTTLNVLGGLGQFTATGSALYIIQPPLASWGLGLNGPGSAYDGVKALGLFDLSGSALVTLTFTDPVLQFGAYFQTDRQNNGTDLSVSFYDASNNLLGSDSFTHASAPYQWHGWADSSGIKKVTFAGNVAPVMDSLQIMAVPEPGTVAALGAGVLAVLRRRKKA